MKRLALALFMLMLTVPAFAQEPVKVSADDLTVDQENRTGTFSGSVVITRAGMTLWADKVIVIYGKGGESDIDSLTATGNVRIKTPTQEATSRQASYDPDTMILKLTEDVTVSNAQGKLNGPELIINLATNSSTFKGGTGGRVTGVFTPQ